MVSPSVKLCSLDYSTAVKVMFLESATYEPAGRLVDTVTQAVLAVDSVGQGSACVTTVACQTINTGMWSNSIKDIFFNILKR